jgi:hypothetical protein
MRYGMLLMCLLFLTVFAAKAQQSDIVFKHYIHNFGELKYGEDAQFVFEFKNFSDTIVLITNVRAKCGCTSTEWTRKPIKKKQKGEIVIEYNTKLVGKFHKSVYVFFNQSNQPIQLQIKGEVKAPQSTNK